MNKEKMQKVNAAIAKSKFAKERFAEALITDDGHLVYQAMVRGRMAQVSFRQILWMIHGEDARALV